MLSLNIIAVNCGPKPSPGSNSVEASNTGTTYQSTVTFQCNAGHETTNGLTLSCLASGSWSAARGPDCTGTYRYKFSYQNFYISLINISILVGKKNKNKKPKQNKTTTTATNTHVLITL